MIKALDGKWGKGLVTVDGMGVEIVANTSITIPFALIETVQVFTSEQKKDLGDAVKVGGSAAVLGGVALGPLGALAGAAFGALTANQKNKTVFGIVTRDGSAGVFEADNHDYMNFMRLYEESESDEFDEEDLSEFERQIVHEEGINALVGCLPYIVGLLAFLAFAIWAATL